MLKRHTQVFSTVLRLIDIFLTFSAWQLAYKLRFFWINVPPASSIPAYNEYFQAAIFVSILTGFVFSFSGVYRLHKVIQINQELFYLLKGVMILMFFTLVTAFFYREFSFSRIHIIYFVVCLLSILFISRLLTRSTLKFLQNKKWYIQHVLLIGKGVSSTKFLQQIERLKSLGIILKGIVELNNSIISKNPQKIPSFGGIDTLQQTIKENQIDQVFIALGPEDQKFLPKLKELLSEQLVDIKIIPDLGTFRKLHSEVEFLGDMPIITIVQSPMTGWNKVLKRIIDIFGSLFAIIIFSPVMLITSLLIKISSEGPIIYSQERMGLDGMKFKALKFRSMHKNAESKTGAVWASENDERRTKLGIFLRKYSLDELPQFFNVIKGEMSLVGPRPERPIFIEKFKSQIPHYMLRHKVKAGITGWAQINGWRGNTSLEKRIEFDLYYIESWSIWFDIKILFLTIFRWLFDSNAY